MMKPEMTRHPSEFPTPRAARTAALVDAGAAETASAT